MKALLRCLIPLAVLTACGEDDKPNDPQPVAAPATYTDASGKEAALSAVKVYSVTAPPTNATPSGQARRAFVVRATLPNGSTMDVTYTYVGSTFPGALGTVKLDEGPLVDNYSQPGTSVSYKAPVTAGTLSVDSITPQVISGAYSGPLVAGGPSVKFVFTKAGI